jgi:secondary thiamine-phosphate synthase enzyme
MHKITVKTRANKEVVDITRQINELIRQQGVAEGVCHVFVMHTTAALTTADLDPGTDLDMLDAFTTMIPDLPYRHPHNPAHAPDHILAALLGPSVTVPVEGGRLVLGTWQRVVLFEFDGPRRRQIVVSMTAEASPS